MRNLAIGILCLASFGLGAYTMRMHIEVKYPGDTMTIWQHQQFDELCQRKAKDGLTEDETTELDYLLMLHRQWLATQ